MELTTLKVIVTNLITNIFLKAMKYILLFILLLHLSSCSNKKQGNPDKNEPTIPKTEVQQTNQKSNSLSIAIGDSITGDFNGDGTLDVAILRIVKEGVFQEEAWTLAVEFSDKDIPSIEFQCDREYSTLINEGDLNNIAGDEITIYSPPLGGCTYHMTTYSLIDHKWKIVVPTFLIPTACEEISNDELQARIFKEGNSIYYYETNHETLELIKTKVN